VVCLNVFRKAFICVDRNGKKSAILFALLFVVSNLIVASLLISQAIHHTVDHFYTTMPNQTVIVTDERHGPGVALEQLDEINSLSYVRNAWYGLHSSVQTSEFNFPLSNDDSGCLEEFGFCSFRVFGTASPILLELAENDIELTSGRIFTDEEISQGHQVVIVSEFFAQVNNLHVGDVVTVELRVHGEYALEDEKSLDIRLGNFYLWYTHEIEMEIVGLFGAIIELPERDREWFLKHGSGGLYRQFYAPNGFVNQILTTQYDIHKMFYTEEEIAMADTTDLGLALLPSLEIKSAIFTLYDFRDFDAFYAQAAEILGQLYDEHYFHIGSFMGFGIGPMSQGMDSMQDIIQNFLRTTIITCIILIGLTILLFFKDRRHELGIYMSLGSKKIKIVAQLILEISFVALPSIILSFFTGGLLANRLNAWLMAEQLIMDIPTPRNLRQYMNAITLDDIYAIHQISLSWSQVLIIIGVLLLVIAVTVVAPTIYLLRLQPKKILLYEKM